MRLISYLGLIFSCFLFTQCKKDTSPTIQSPSELKEGMLVLNEGLFQLNNSSLSWVQFGSGESNDQFFTQKTGRLLGDTGNDLKRYGNKIYIVVNVSSTIEVLDAITGNPLQQISMQFNGNAKQPRKIEFYGAKAYISCFDGYVDVLDTATLKIVQRIPVGLNPDEMTISGNHLFVSNSGGLNSPTMDSTVSVIDLNSQIELTKIAVGMNPGSITTDSQGEVYVIARGNYSSVPSRLKKINPISLTLEKSFDFNATKITTMNDQLLILNANQVILLNAITDAIISTNFIDTSGITTLSNCYFNHLNQCIYLFDSKGYTNTGSIFVYSVNGNFIKSYSVGLNPNSILIYA